MFVFPQPQFVACENCGAAVPKWEIDRDEHVCDRERWLDYQIVKLRPRIRAFDADLAAWLATPSGRFEVWYAERGR